MCRTYFFNPLFTRFTGVGGYTRGKGESISKRLYFSPGHVDKAPLPGKTGKELPGEEIQLYTLPFQELY